MVSELAIVSIRYEALFSDVVLPQRSTSGAAGYDVRAHIQGRNIEIINRDGRALNQVCADQLHLPAGARSLIPLGFKATLPSGVEAQLRLRSSVAFRKGLFLPNSPATIDPDYPSEWLLVLANLSGRTVAVAHLERIAQVVFSRFEVADWRPGKVMQTTERAGGLGSTD